MLIFPFPHKKGELSPSGENFWLPLSPQASFYRTYRNLPPQTSPIIETIESAPLFPLCHWFSTQYSCRRRIHASFCTMCATGVDSARIRHWTRRIPLDSGYLPPSNRWGTSPSILAKRWETFLFRWETFCSCSPSSPLSSPLFSIVIALSERYLYPCIAQV